MKKIITTLALVFPFLALADNSASSSIQLPSDFVANIWQQANALFGSLGVYIATIIGILVVAIVIEIIIGALK